MIGLKGNGTCFQYQDGYDLQFYIIENSLLYLLIDVKDY